MKQICCCIPQSHICQNENEQLGHNEGGERKKEKEEYNGIATLTQRATHLCAHTCESSVAFSYETAFHSLDGCTTKVKAPSKVQTFEIVKQNFNSNH